MGDVGTGVRLRFWKTDPSSNLSWISPAQCGLGRELVWTFVDKMRAQPLCKESENYLPKAELGPPSL